MSPGLPAPIEALFARCPALHGFSVRSDSASELFVADVGIAPELSTEHHNEIFDEIVVALAELIAEEPGAGDVLRGRTFARVVH